MSVYFKFPCGETKSKWLAFQEIDFEKNIVYT